MVVNIFARFSNMHLWPPTQTFLGFRHAFLPRVTNPQESLRWGASVHLQRITINHTLAARSKERYRSRGQIVHLNLECF